MDFAGLLKMIVRSVIEPEKVWDEVLSSRHNWKDLLIKRVVPVAASVLLLTAIMQIIFGIRMPGTGVVIHQSAVSILLQNFFSFIIFLLMLLLSGWIAVKLLVFFETEESMDNGVAMIFYTSIPSLLGQIFNPLPFIGFIVSLALGIYSLVLLWRAIPVYLNISTEKRWKYFLLFFITILFLSIFVGGLLGMIFKF